MTWLGQITQLNWLIPIELSQKSQLKPIPTQLDWK